MEEIKVTENLRQTKLKAEELKLFKQSFVIVPYQVSGFLDYTNRGVTWSPVNPNNFETFKRVWTGNEACSIMWKGSFKLIQDEDTKEMKEKYELGEVFLGLMETNSFDNILEKDKSFSDYISQEQVSHIKFRVDKKFKITDYYNFMFYKIPELSGSTIYRIENIEKDFVGLELVGYVINFVSLNQELANTGRARQQNISPNAPGQGYLECIVEDEEWPLRLGEEKFNKLVEGKDYYKLYNRYITGDFSKTKPNPVKKVVVKLLGNGILGSFSMTGRSVNPDIPLTDNFGAQKLLFPINFSNASTPTLMRTQNNSQNFYFGEFFPSLHFYKEFYSSIKDFFGNTNMFNYEGVLYFNYDKLKGTNLIKNGSYENNLYGYWDEQANVNKVWNFEQERRTINTTGSLGCGVEYIIGGKKPLHDHMFDNFWVQKQLKTLPQNIYETTGFGQLFTSAFSIGLSTSLVSWPVTILGFLAGSTLATIGAVGLAKQTKPMSSFIPFRGIVSAPFIDYNKDLFGNTIGELSGYPNKIPFNFLNNENTNSPNQAFFKGNTINISFEAEITDSFFDTRIQKIMNTENIGQKKYKNGDYIFPNTEETFELDGSANLIESSSYGFIIDTFQVQAIFNGEISVEFLDSEDNLVWSGIYQSEAKWSDSMREVWTQKSCSTFGLENMYFSEPIPYPKKIENKKPTPKGAITIEQFKVISKEWKWEGVNRGDYLEYYYGKSGGYLGTEYYLDFATTTETGTFKFLEGQRKINGFQLINYDTDKSINSFSEFKAYYKVIKASIFEDNIFENIYYETKHGLNIKRNKIYSPGMFKIFDDIVWSIPRDIQLNNYWEVNIKDKDFEKDIEQNFNGFTKRYYCPFEKVYFGFYETTNHLNQRILYLGIDFRMKNQITSRVKWGIDPRNGYLEIFSSPLVGFYRYEAFGASNIGLRPKLYYVGDGKSDYKPFKIEKNIQCLVRITK